MYRAFQDELKEHPDAFELRETGCIGMCYREVLVEIGNGNGANNLYAEVTPDRVGRIVDEDILNDKPIAEWLVNTDPHEMGFFDNQIRIVLRNCGKIDPGSIDEYIAHGGYSALSKKSLQEMTPQIGDRTK